jgi:hypothetical protein
MGVVSFTVGGQYLVNGARVPVVANRADGMILIIPPLRSAHCQPHVLTPAEAREAAESLNAAADWLEAM